MDITSESFVETIPPTPVTPTTPTPLPNPSSFDSLPPVENLIERKSTPNDEYYMYTLTNPNGYKGVTSKRPPRAVSIVLFTNFYFYNYFLSNYDYFFCKI